MFQGGKKMKKRGPKPWDPNGTGSGEDEDVAEVRGITDQMEEQQQKLMSLQQQEDRRKK